jgi:hypothetical protein
VYCGIAFTPTASVSNGVKHGAILSPLLFCVCYDNLHQALRWRGVGCHVGGLFFGALAHADNIVLLAPSANAMRLMLSVCDSYSAEFNSSFNAAKSKCPFFVAVICGAAHLFKVCLSS